jgi:amidase
MKFEEYRRQDAICSRRAHHQPRGQRYGGVGDCDRTGRANQSHLNSIVHKQYEQARKAVAAGLPEGPLKGVPYLIKDLGFFETGEPATFGSSLF